MIDFMIFIIGLCVGSFLNVCIYRIPTAKSIVRPRSFCPMCKAPIPWYDNIPVLSYILLMGRCRRCRMPISPRYVMVEILSALLALGLYGKFGLTPDFGAYALFAAALVTVTFIDLEHREVPDVISLWGMAAGVALFSVLRLDGGTSFISSFAVSMAGLLAGGAMMFILGVAGEMVFRKEALGGGDVKLMAMIGSFLGWKLAVMTFFMAPILGAGIALFMKLKYKTEAVPYAPYLAAGALINLFWGSRIIELLFPLS